VYKLVFIPSTVLINDGSSTAESEAQVQYMSENLRNESPIHIKL
jgi:hypothetical protein